MEGSQDAPRPDEAAPVSVLDASGRMPPGTRFDAWETHVGPFFEVQRPDGAALDRFRARLAVGLLGDLIVGRCAASGQRFSRSALKTARDADDHLLIQLFLDGETRARVGGREVTARRGDLWIVDMLEPMAADNPAFCNLSLVVPRQLVEGGLRDPGGHHQRVIRGDEPMARIFAAHLRTLAAALGELRVDDAVRLEPATLRLTEALLNAVPGGRRPELDPAGAERALLFAARRLIEERLADPALGPDFLARALGLSRARLYRAFAPVGGVSSYIRGRRLKRSLADLLDPAMAHRPIYDIAYAWCFASESDYSRAFRRRFGLSPREARRSGLARAGDAATPSARWLRELGR